MVGVENNYNCREINYICSKCYCNDFICVLCLCVCVTAAFLFKKQKKSAGRESMIGAESDYNFGEINHFLVISVTAILIIIGSYAYCYCYFLLEQRECEVIAENNNQTFMRLVVFLPMYVKYLHNFRTDYTDH